MEDIVDLTIQTLNLRGLGVASLPRSAPLPPLQVEVAHALVGDRVRLEMRKKMRGVRKGRILEIIEPSPDRVETPCAHARVCGGCSWQQMAYAAQLSEKMRRVREAFGGEADIRPILPAPALYRYRNKMEFTFSENRGGTRYLGLMIAQCEPYVYNTEECHLCNPWFSAVLRAVRSWWEVSQLKAYHPHRDEGTLRYITLREGVRTQQKMVVLNISGHPDYAPSRGMLDDFVRAIQTVLPDEPLSIFLRIHQTKKGRPTQFYEMHLSGPDHIVEQLHLEEGPLSFKISPSSFFQPNTLQAERLYDAALHLLKPLRPALVYDLYCGTGTLAMIAARASKQVIGIELSADAVLDAEENAKRNALGNCTFLQGDVGKTLTQLLSAQDGARSGAQGGARPDAIIVDPPRAGLDPLALHHLKTLLPKAILYISCNPTTQAQNVRELLQAGYRIEALQPVDQFPHTYHIENIALLVR